MKQFVKKLLMSLRLLDYSRAAYSFVTNISFKTLRRELEIRRRGLPDHLPAPPPRLIFLVIRSVWSDEYWKSGLTIVADLEDQLRYHKIDPHHFHRILDFGCGCGRLTRQLARFENAQLFGSDYNKELIDWCSHTLPIAQWSGINIAPPLPFESAYFDCILARSVFTHIDRQLQHAWIEEFHRILHPGGILYFTTHNASSAARLGTDLVQQVNTDGFAAQHSEIQGDNKCSVYETREWVCGNLADGYSVKDYIPGRRDRDLGQDIYIFQKAI